MTVQLISHYKILAPLGSGGMGVVYRAEDTALHRTVALKFLPEMAAGSPKSTERLRREARAASALNHPNICTIYEVGEDGGRSFIAMEYVEGRTLAELIRQGTLPSETVLRYGRQIASALAHAHDAGVIHGDLKPQNIVVTPCGEAKILDFGLARRMDPAEFDKKTLETLSGECGLGGTLPYMAPEQIEGNIASVQTDIWSFGILLYEMATGDRPFHGGNLVLLCNAILRDPPRPVTSSVFPGVTTIISQCLEKEPERRYRQAGEARAALEALTPSIDKRVLLPRRQPLPYRLLLILLALALVASSVAVAFVIRERWFWKPISNEIILSVLPPVSNGDASQSAFDSGLVDTLNSRLGELSAHHRFAVIPMNTIIEKGVSTVDRAREEFGVSLVLVLNVQRAADKVRVNYALVDPRSHHQVRSGTITADASDPFGLQDRVFESVAAAMELQLEPQEKQLLIAHGTTEPAAYDFYIQGRGYLQDYVVPERVESALMLFGRALERDPAFAAATAGLGEAYFRKFQLTHDYKWADKSIASCQRAAELGPNFAPAHTCLGRVFIAKGNYDKAVEQYRRALELEPSNDAALGGLASTYDHLGQLGEAENLYKRAIAARPAYWATYNWLGFFYMGHARYEDAASMYSQVVSLAPDSFTGYYNLGAVRILQGKYSEAIPFLERSLSIRPSSDAFSNLGTAYFQMRRYEESASNFEKAIELDQNNYVIWGNLGDCYYWTPGRRNEAMAAYANAISLGEKDLHRNPRDPQLLAYLAEYHAMRGERKAALANLDVSLSVQPESPDLLFTAGIIYQQLGDTNRAIDALERAISLGLTTEMLRDTPNFDAIRENPRFLGLVNGGQRK